MFRSRLSLRLFTLGALLLLSVSTTTVAAQSSPLNVVQASDGTLYLEQGSNAWTMVPNHISDSDLAALTPSGELDGAIPAAFLGNPGSSTVLQVVQGSDGTFYIDQGNSVWTLVPNQISDSDLAALTQVGEVDGQISSPTLQQSATPLPVSPPPAATNPPVPLAATATPTAVPTTTVLQIAPSELISTLTPTPVPSMPTGRSNGMWVLFTNSDLHGWLILTDANGNLSLRPNGTELPLTVTAAATGNNISIDTVNGWQQKTHYSGVIAPDWTTMQGTFVQGAGWQQPRQGGWGAARCLSSTNCSNASASFMNP